MKVRNGISALMLAGVLMGSSACGSETGPSGSDPYAPGDVAATESTGAGTSTETSGSGSASAEAEPAAEAMITIKDFKYEIPESIAPGATVTVINEDDVPHTVTAKDDGGFDVEAPPGETVTFTAPEEPGDYAVICTFHPEMSGTLVIS